MAAALDNARSAFAPLKQRFAAHGIVYSGDALALIAAVEAALAALAAGDTEDAPPAEPLVEEPVVEAPAPQATVAEAETAMADQPGPADPNATQLVEQPNPEPTPDQPASQDSPGALG